MNNTQVKADKVPVIEENRAVRLEDKYFQNMIIRNDASNLFFLPVTGAIADIHI
jgi:hypothetical protein